VNATLAITDDDSSLYLFLLLVYSPMLS